MAEEEYDDYCSYCGDITNFSVRRCKECEKIICKKCLVKFKEIDEDDYEDLWEEKEEYCGNCAVSILEKRNKYFGRKIYCTNCGNKRERGLGNFCPKCGVKFNKGVTKKVKLIGNK